VHFIKRLRPSSGDAESTYAIATKNNFKMMWQIITTFQDSGKSDRQQDSKRIIEMNAFCYTEASGWQPKRCAIEVLPGISPLRVAITNEIWRKRLFPELQEQYLFPLERIHIVTPQNNNSPDVPQEIQRGIQELPVNIRKLAKIDFREDFIILILPILNQDAKIYIASQNNPPHQLVAVYLIDNKADHALINYTDQILSSGSPCTFSSVYEAAKEIHLENLVA